MLVNLLIYLTWCTVHCILLFHRIVFGCRLQHYKLRLFFKSFVSAYMFLLISSFLVLLFWVLGWALTHRDRCLVTSVQPTGQSLPFNGYYVMKMTVPGLSVPSACVFVHPETRSVTEKLINKRLRINGCGHPHHHHHPPTHPHTLICYFNSLGSLI